MKYANTVKSGPGRAILFLPLIFALGACGTASVTQNDPGSSSGAQPPYPASQTAVATATSSVANTSSQSPAPVAVATPINNTPTTTPQAGAKQALSAFWGLAFADDVSSPAVVLLLSTNANWCNDANSGILLRGSKDTFTLVEDLAQIPTAAKKVYNLRFYQVTRAQTASGSANQCATVKTLLPDSNAIPGVTFNVAAGSATSQTLSGSLTLPSSQALGATQVPIAASFCQALINVYDESMSGTAVSYACGK